MSWGLSSRAVSSLLALLAAGSVVRAQEHSEPAPSASQGRPSHQTAVGTLTAYDPVTRVLTACNAAGSSDFHVAADARVWLGNRRLPIAQLGAHAGAQVTVAWSEADGVRTTHTVRVTDTRPAHAR
jgi:phage baseplate assembly protein gpV